MTADGYTKLQNELNNFVNKQRPENIEAIAEARSHGDLSENAEYDAAKQRKEFVQAQLARLYDKRQSLSGISELMIPRDSIGFWSKVKVLDLDNDEEIEYRLVSPDESDPRNHRISVSSPIGRALLGKIDGDAVDIETPRGRKAYEILEFSTVHEASDLDD